MDGCNIAIPSTVAESLSTNNTDEPWRPFGVDMCHYANGIGNLKAILVTILYRWSWLLRGRLWVAILPISTAVKTVRVVTTTNGTGTESQYVWGLRDQNIYGRTEFGS